MGPRASSDEYRALRDLADGLTNEAPDALAELVGDLKTFLRDFSELFERMIERVMALNRLALDFWATPARVSLKARVRFGSRGAYRVAQVAQHLAWISFQLAAMAQILCIPARSLFSSGGKGGVFESARRFAWTARCWRLFA